MEAGNTKNDVLVAVEQLHKFFDDFKWVSFVDWQYQFTTAQKEENALSVLPYQFNCMTGIEWTVWDH
ncbi:hypothetical protein VroAM7_50470 (plasmid) [Vibrio rotiferianus]|uniref:Uncharacterized protein n=1 Tax=Vibrio rotiferianus TaxID=190895 RepID=A0A510IF39_9VIBR|nr:hypothetical protein VroAM7_50470 [Vibrio rotiferianus]